MATEAPRAVYLDSSAILKLVVRERETDDLVAFLAAAQLVSSEVALVEVPRAAHLRTGVESSIEHGERLLGSFFLVALDEQLHRAAARARPPELRALDAVHLASALSVRGEVEAVVVYDRRLAGAARDTGLSVMAPGAAGAG